LLIVSPSKVAYKALEALLAKKFVFEPGKPAHIFLGANLHRVNKHVIQLGHTAYIRKMAKTFAVKPKGRVETPSKINLKALVDELEETKQDRPMDAKLLAVYRSRVGSLLYCARAVRIDIGHAVGFLCRCLTYADERALQATDDCLNYLVSQDDLPLTYDGSQGLGLDAYCDAVWGVGPYDRLYRVPLQRPRRLAFG
jgi:hypothetical protein